MLGRPTKSGLNMFPESIAQITMRELEIISGPPVVVGEQIVITTTDGHLDHHDRWHNLCGQKHPLLTGGPPVDLRGPPVGHQCATGGPLH